MTKEYSTFRRHIHRNIQVREEILSIPIIITITIDPHALIIPQHTTEIHHPHQHQVQIHPHVPQDPPAEDLVAVNKIMRSPLCIPSVAYQPTEYSAILIFTSFA